MGTTPLGIVYPDSTGHTRMWEHLETLADDVDGLIDTDRDKRDAAFTSWTPVITGSTSGTWVAGGTTINATYLRIGRLVLAWIDLSLGASVSISGATAGSLLCSLPVAAKASHPGHIGTGLAIEGSGGRWGLEAEFNTTTTFVSVVDAHGAVSGAILVNQTPNGNVWASGDVLRWQLMYEAASAAP